MKTFSILTGAAGLAALVAAASPAAAQQYPYGYPQAQPQGGVIGAIINSVTGAATPVSPAIRISAGGERHWSRSAPRRPSSACPCVSRNGYAMAIKVPSTLGANNGYPQQAGGACWHHQCRASRATAGSHHRRRDVGPRYSPANRAIRQAQQASRSRTSASLTGQSQTAR